MLWDDLLGDFVAEVVSKVLEVPITLSDTQKQVEYGSPGRVVRAVVRLLKHRCSCLAEKNCTKLQAFSEKKTCYLPVASSCCLIFDVMENQINQARGCWNFGSYFRVDEDPQLLMTS